MPHRYVPVEMLKERPTLILCGSHETTQLLHRRTLRSAETVHSTGGSEARQARNIFEFSSLEVVNELRGHKVSFATTNTPFQQHDSRFRQFDSSARGTHVEPVDRSYTARSLCCIVTAPPRLTTTLQRSLPRPTNTLPCLP